MDRLPRTVQTNYAELLEQLQTSQLEAYAAVPGSFTRRVRRGREYWYFRHTDGKEEYIGPDSEELGRRVESYKEARTQYRARRKLVSMLVRGGVPAPEPGVGAVLDALARAGIFRLRSVLVGTTAFQTYSGLLGVRLGGAALRTEDIDLAQFPSISLHLDDHLNTPFLDVLREVDPSFQAVPGLHGNATTTYATAAGLRIELLAANEGADRDAPLDLSALGAQGQPLRFLDYLIHGEIPAALLYAAGVLVNVPQPAHFAVHKLIVARRREGAGQAKIEKDLAQARELLLALSELRPFELADAFEEAVERGPAWRQLIDEGLALVDAADRHAISQAMNRTKEAAQALPKDVRGALAR